jgi:hypothetical protein
MFKREGETAKQVNGTSKPRQGTRNRSEYSFRDIKLLEQENQHYTYITYDKRFQDY